MIAADGQTKPVVIVRVPATSANVGVGFDCLGIALDLTATFLMSPSEALEIDGALKQAAFEIVNKNGVK